MNRQIRILLGRLLLLGAYSGFFWGIIYPELCLTEDICVVAEGENIDPGQLPEELEQAIREGKSVNPFQPAGNLERMVGAIAV